MPPRKIRKKTKKKGVLKIILLIIGLFLLFNLIRNTYKTSSFETEINSFNKFDNYEEGFLPISNTDIWFDDEIRPNIKNVMAQAKENIYIDNFLLEFDSNLSDILQETQNINPETRQEHATIDYLFTIHELLEENEELTVTLLTDEINKRYLNSSYDYKNLKSLNVANPCALLKDTRFNCIYHSTLHQKPNFLVIRMLPYEEILQLTTSIERGSGKNCNLIVRLIERFFKALRINSNHLKAVVIDHGSKVIIGSRNFNDKNDNNSDVMFLFEGDAAKNYYELEKILIKNSIRNNYWQNNLQYLQSVIKNNPYDPENNEFEYLSLFDEGSKTKLFTGNQFRRSIIQTIQKSAPESELNIAIANISCKEIINEIVKANERGVKVRIIVDDNKYIFQWKFPNMPNIKAIRIFKDLDIPIKVYKTDYQFHQKILSATVELGGGIKKNVVLLSTGNFTHGAVNRHAYDDVALLIEDEKTYDKFNSYFNNLWESEQFIGYTDDQIYTFNGFTKSILISIMDYSGLNFW